MRGEESKTLRCQASTAISPRRGDTSAVKGRSASDAAAATDTVAEGMVLLGALPSRARAPAAADVSRLLRRSPRPLSLLSATSAW